MDIIEKQIEYLNETMKDTASEANSFLLKYHFGGLVAVLALLNLDLVLIDSVRLKGILDYLLLFGAVVLVILLSQKYFQYVLVHYKRFTESHRKLKYKYELTLHFSLSNGEVKDYQYYLEQDLGDSIDESADRKLRQPDFKDYGFVYVANYLLNHHRLRFLSIGKKEGGYLKMAMSVIYLTLAIRTIFLIIGN